MSTTFLTLAKMDKRIPLSFYTSGSLRIHSHRPMFYYLFAVRSLLVIPDSPGVTVPDAVFTLVTVEMFLVYQTAYSCPTQLVVST